MERLRGRAGPRSKCQTLLARRATVLSASANARWQARPSVRPQRGYWVSYAPWSRRRRWSSLSSGPKNWHPQSKARPMATRQVCDDTSNYAHPRSGPGHLRGFGSRLGTPHTSNSVHLRIRAACGSWDAFLAGSRSPVSLPQTPQTGRNDPPSFLLLRTAHCRV
jgi:hypothetical protein